MLDSKRVQGLFSFSLPQQQGWNDVEGLVIWRNGWEGV